MSLNGTPVVDVTYYLRGGPFNRETAFSARSPKYGTGTTLDTPIAVPTGTRIYGLNVKIGNIRDIFYDFHTGECHYYVDGWDIEVTSDYIYRTYGEGASWILHRYEGTSPADYLELDIPSVWEQQGYADGPFEPNINGNALYVNVWRRRWQVFEWPGDPDPPWSWDWEKVYTVTHYLKHTPWIKVTSEPSFANVKINPQRAGHPVYNGVTPCIYMPSMEFSGRTPFVIDISKDKYAPVTEGVELRWDGTSEFDHGYAVKHFVLNYQSCTHPDKPHGGTACSGYDKIQCNAGTWDVIEEDSPECGYPKPKAKLSASWRGGSAPLVVTFTDGSTNDPKAWVWSFGDGTGSTDQNPPPHTYAEAGTYAVTLEVSNQSGSDIASATIGVTPAPVAAFEAHPSKGPIPLTVSFSNLSENTEIYEWDFGNGATSTDSNPSHTYRTPGEYVVTLTARNFHNEQSVATATVTAIEPEVPPPETEEPPPTAHLDPILIGLAAAAGIGAFAYLKRRPSK